MQCQNCGQRPASVQLYRDINGHRDTMELCAHCASHAQASLGQPFSLENLIEGLFGLRGEGEALLGMKKPAEAIALFEHALAIRQKAGMPAPMIKEATDAIADAKKRSHR